MRKFTSLEKPRLTLIVLAYNEELKDKGKDVGHRKRAGETGKVASDAIRVEAFE